MSEVHQPWRQFAVRVFRVQPLSRSFLRVTFTGEDLDAFADNGFDQRIKLIFPLPEVGLAYLPSGSDWYLRWRELPDVHRNPIRTYTVRAARPSVRELDVDLVHHGDAGPASRWASQARPGDALMLIGPNAAHPGPHGGLEFHPPAGTSTLLLAGDETAAPAIGAILERLPPESRGEALLEVPYGEDALPVTPPPGVRVTWLPRGQAAPGAELIPAVSAAGRRLLEPARSRPVSSLVDVDVDRELLWDVPDSEPAAPCGWYAWLAGEAGVIRTLRRHLVTEVGVDRGSVAFMGYWRLGRAEPEG